ncbi:aldo/keto reductase [Aquincola sp. S2]|uniref:Aldo/keto reductase n=1 Tax=Pseudaquabacterium terrae TaxID=2732868 RepID=A0ABX2EJH1_9BURK|nr:aldo/keto reductase [Aquabacterium terrae]NRF68780.1 aldo/keto reductase [Aquabacterium terrae]
MNHLLSPIVAGAWRMASWNLTPQQRLRWIEQNLELGITSFDHADIYGGYQVEQQFGEALALAPALRHELQLVTKCGIKLVSPARPGHRFHCYDTSAAHVRASVDNSLRALRSDHIDLLLIHRPDALMDAAELADTFAALRREGKVHHFGVSNFTPSQLELLHHRCPLVTNQLELSPLRLDALHDGTLDQCQRLGLRPMIWSPLAGGRIFTGEDEAARRVRHALQALADELGTTITTLVFAWLLRHPSRPLPVIGSQRIEASREAVAALDLKLTAEQWYRIWTAGAGHEVP